LTISSAVLSVGVIFTNTSQGFVTWAVVEQDASKAIVISTKHILIYADSFLEDGDFVFLQLANDCILARLIRTRIAKRESSQYGDG
jgi:hypothetical protein